MRGAVTSWTVRISAECGVDSWRRFRFRARTERQKISFAGAADRLYVYTDAAAIAGVGNSPNSFRPVTTISHLFLWQNQRQHECL